MALSSSLVPYRPRPSNTMTLHPLSGTLISSHLFTQQTGTAVATELLYRLLVDILNRLLSSLQRLAAQGLDDASSWIQRKLQERRDRLDAAAPDPSIVQEVGKLAQQRGFTVCPLTGRAMKEEMPGKRGPPVWVRGVLEGIDQGRIEERDIWVQTHGD